MINNTNLVFCDYQKVCYDTLQRYLSENSLLRFNWTNMIYLWFISTTIVGLIIPLLKRKIINPNRLELLDLIAHNFDYLNTALSIMALIMVIAL